MLLRNISVALVSAALMSACGSPKDANKANFAKAIEAHLAKTCFTGGTGTLGADPYPKTIYLLPYGGGPASDVERKLNAESTSAFDALAKAGLLTSEDTQVTEQFFGNKIRPAKKFSLTDAGKAALVSASHDEFCAGHYHVDEVVSFTEPANGGGTIVSRVNYTFSPADVASWAKDPSVQARYRSLAGQLSDHQDGIAEAVLQNDGWVVNRAKSDTE